VHGNCTVRNKLKPVLAKHNVKGTIREGQGHGKHCRVHIERDHLPVRPHQWRCLARNNARPARHVEDSLPWLGGGMAAHGRNMAGTK